MLDTFERADTAQAELSLEPISNMRPLPVEVKPPAVSPSFALIQEAARRNASLDELDRWLNLHDRMEAAAARAAFVEAMTTFKAEPLRIVKRKHVGYETKEGDFVGYRHAELSDVTEVVCPAMARHGLSHRWDVQQNGDHITVACIVTHVRGHSETVQMTGRADSSGKKNAIQSVASTVTYLQRYTLMAATGTAATGVDDDGAGGADADNGASAAHHQHEDQGRDERPTNTYPEETFRRYFPDWQAAIRAGKKTADQVIRTIETKAPLTEQQKAELRQAA